MPVLRRRADTGATVAADDTGTMRDRPPPAPVYREVAAARGGVSLWSVITGVLVAFGAAVILVAIVAGILAAISGNNAVSRGDLVHAGIGGGIGLVIAQFLAYLWGGYAAGRMARGLGAVNGFLVPLVAILIGIVIGAIVYALGANQIDFGNLNLPFNAANLRHTATSATARSWGVGLGIATLVAMFLGGVLGGGMGSRWHTKLERGAAETS